MLLLTFSSVTAYHVYFQIYVHSVTYTDRDESESPGEWSPGENNRGMVMQILQALCLHLNSKFEIDKHIVELLISAPCSALRTQG